MVLNWLSVVVVGVGGSDFIGYLPLCAGWTCKVRSPYSLKPSSSRIGPQEGRIKVLTPIVNSNQTSSRATARDKQHQRRRSTRRSNDGIGSDLSRKGEASSGNRDRTLALASVGWSGFWVLAESVSNCYMNITI